MILLCFDNSKYNQSQDDKNYDAHDDKDDSMLHDSKKIDKWGDSFHMHADKSNLLEMRLIMRPPLDMSSLVSLNCNRLKNK